MIMDSFTRYGLIHTPAQKWSEESKSTHFFRERERKKNTSPGQLAWASQQRKSRMTVVSADRSRDPARGTKRMVRTLPLKPAMRAGSRLEASPLWNGYSIGGREEMSPVSKGYSVTTGTEHGSIWLFLLDTAGNLPYYNKKTSQSLKCASLINISACGYSWRGAPFGRRNTW